MDSLPFNLQGVVEDVRFQNGVNVPTIRTTYKLGNFGPFVFVMDKDAYTAQAVQDAAAKMRAELQALS